MEIECMEFKPGPDRTVEPENPRTVHIYGPFKVKNRSMRKKHGTVRTAVRPSGSVNRERFGRFKRAALFCLKTAPFRPFFFFFFFFLIRRRFGLSEI